MRRPFLVIKLGCPYQISEEDPLHRGKSKWLRVQIENKKLPEWLSWVYQGEPALTCRAWITFFFPNGQRVFDHDMEARWTGSEEPKVEIINTEKGNFARLVGV